MMVSREEGNGMYLLILQGGDDVEIKIIGPKAWEYLNSPPPKLNLNSSGKTEKLSPEILAEADSIIGSKREEPVTEIYVTSGSWDNDRALCLEGKCFDSTREAYAWVKKQGQEILDEYHGYIY